ncbi:segregation and condensation protein A [Sphingobacterium hungaricum]|uniref:Segregation and condensation protein A n=1 Tax=Sphingobacterium hungaricum TaxID=2082723 RepID=A0A928UU50_9SPHI|nr:segregation/condensation protein A [Sphingobacterium hungaricum]MBE8712943.1 chromosome segregation protein ScpA [Sphingobacterium hungaricum]
MSEANYQIILPHFEGPFDLLLFFIERDELNIHDIPISKITDDFLDYLHHMQTLNMDLASEFIVVAATLMRIKAKMLLPRQPIDADGNELDLKEDLIRKLLLYKQFKQVCEELRVLENSRSKLVERANIQADLKRVKKSSSAEEELAQFDLYKLLMVYSKLMFSYKNRVEEVRHTVVSYPYTIEAQKFTLTKLIEINKKLDFNLIKKNSENKVQFVYNFLAVLEMLQQELIDIQVGLGYNNFWIERR